MKVRNVIRKKSKGTSLGDVRHALKGKSNTELIVLISDLYSFSAENRKFVDTRCALGEDPLEDYKRIISSSIFPDFSERETFKLSTGKKAISDYFKASKDEVGKLELQMHYLEQGTKCSLNYGDIGEQFYLSLESMFSAILKVLKKQKGEEQKKYLNRLRDVVSSSKGIGWGYYDSIFGLLAEYEKDV